MYKNFTIEQMVQWSSDIQTKSLEYKCRFPCESAEQEEREEEEGGLLEV